NDGANLTTEYTYDANGNMLTDANKGISSNIQYNHLNLPTQVTLNGGNIQYIYDATGVKQKKIVSNGTTTYYAGNYIYEGNSLKFFSHPEGYIEPNGSNFDYVYQYKDHLGNIRLAYSDSNNNGSVNASEIKEENNYYPFGLKHKGYNNVINGVENPYNTFQGQEISKELGYNMLEFKFRHYDPAIGRFVVVDPLAEHYSYNSTYAFQENKLGLGIELEGLEMVLLPAYGKGVTSQDISRQQEANRVAGTVAAVGQLAMVVPVVVANVGVEATAAFVVQEAAETAFESITSIPVILDPVDVIQNFTKKGLFKGGEKMASHEKKRVAEYLEDGSSVSQIKRTDTKTADFEIDGKITEFKALTGEKLNINTGVTRLKDATKKEGVEVIDLDIRAVGGTKANAQDIYDRFKGTDAGKSFKGQVRIATDDGLVNF
ncbi:RHS repeat-associated core domain-containing protein, partial [Winogradskyella haliclonae]|uniref:RHS repeat-associated core domain-containing protein n=1 Tax=Winogradskyella haliclonae TaxID=2048558 RepID=UPI00280A6B4D